MASVAEAVGKSLNGIYLNKEDYQTEKEIYDKLEKGLKDKGLDFKFNVGKKVKKNCLLVRLDLNESVIVMKDESEIQTIS